MMGIIRQSAVVSRNVLDGKPTWFTSMFTTLSYVKYTIHVADMFVVALHASLMVGAELVTIKWLLHGTTGVK